MWLYWNLSIGIALWHGCSPVNLLHIFRTFFSKNISVGGASGVFPHELAISGVTAFSSPAIVLKETLSLAYHLSNYLFGAWNTSIPSFAFVWISQIVLPSNSCSVRPSPFRFGAIVTSLRSTLLVATMSVL